MADSSVRVIISALTEGAQQGIEDVGDELAGLRVDSSIASGGLDSVEDEMDSAAGGAGVLSFALGRLKSSLRSVVLSGRAAASSIDEVGDEATESAAEVGFLSTVMWALLDVTDSNLLIFDLMGGSFAALGPILVGVVAALAPVIASLGVAATAAVGLATGLGLVVGTGAVAGFKQLKKEATATAKELRAIATEFGQQFVPLLSDAIAALPELARRVLSAAGDLDPFVQALRDAGQAAMTVIPQMVGFFTDLGRQSLPIVRDLATYLTENAGPAFGVLLNATQKVGPEMIALGQATLTFLAELTRFGAVAGEVVYPALTALLETLTRLMAVFSSPPPGLANALQRAGEAGREFLTATQPLRAELVPLVRELGILGANAVTIAAKIGSVLAPAATVLLGVLVRVLSGVNDVTAALMGWGGATTRAGQAVTSLQQTVATALGSILATVRRAGAGFWAAWYTSFGDSALYNRLPVLLNGVHLAIAAAIQGFIALVNGDASTFRNAWRGFLMGARTAVEQGVLLIRGVVSRGVSAIQSRIRRFSTAAEGTWSALWSRLPGPARKAFATISGKARRVLGALRQLWTQHSAVVTGVVATIRQTLGRLAQKFGVVDQQGQIVVQGLLKMGTTLLGLVSPIGTVLTTLPALISAFDSADLNVSQLETTIRTGLTTALGVGFVGAVSAAAVILRSQLFSALSLAGGAISSLTGGARTAATASTRLTKFLVDMRARAALLGRILKGVLYGSLLSVRGAVVSVVTSFAGRFAPILSRVSGLVGRLAKIVGGRLLSTFVSVGGRLALLVSRFAGLGSAIALLTNPIGLVVAAIAGLAIAWKTNLFGIQDVTRRIFGALKAAFRGDMSQLSTLTGQGTSKIRGAWKKLQRLVTDARQIFNQVGQAVMAGLNWLYTNAVIPILNSVRQHWDQHGAEIMDSVNQLFTFLKRVFTVTLNILQGIWKRWGDQILTVAKFAFDAIGSVINTFVDLSLTAFDVFTDLLVGDWDSALGKIRDFGERVLDGLVNFVITWGGRFVGWIGDILSNALDAFVQWGTDLIFGSLIPEILSAIISALTSWSLVSTIKGILSTAFTKFENFGSDALGAVNDLLSEAVSAVTSWNLAKKVEGIVDDALAAVTGAVSDFGDAGDALIGAMADGIKDAGGKAVDAAKGAVGKVRDFLPGSDAKRGPLSDLTDAGAALPSTLAEGMLANLRPATRAAREAARAARPALSAGAVGMAGAGIATGAVGGGGAFGGGGTVNEGDQTTIEIDASMKPGAIELSGGNLDEEDVERIIGRQLNERDREIIRALRRAGLL